MKTNRLVQIWILKKGFILWMVMAFLLGRATILADLFPFAIAFFAVVYYTRRAWLIGATLAIVAGSLFSLQIHTGYIVTELLVFILLQKGLEKYEKADISYVPILSFVSVFLVQLFSISVHVGLNGYALLITTVEALLSLILTLIFMQAVSVFTLAWKKQGLKSEEIVCMIILLASVMTGTVGWTIGSVSVEHVLSRFLILLFAIVGGAPLGASVGVITGLILSLADTQAVVEISLLAFAGMLAGLLKEGGKLVVALGMLLGASILTIYIGDKTNIMTSTWESLAAIAIFILTSRSLPGTLAKYIPGTRENMRSQYEYARRVRDLTAGKVEQFSEVFRMLSNSFRQIAVQGETVKREIEDGHLMNEVANKTCTTCWKRKECWEGKFNQTYTFMMEVIQELEAGRNLEKRDIKPNWKRACIRPDQVLLEMKRQYDIYCNNLHWRRQVVESRKLVSDQLEGVSQVMEDLAKEIKREGQEMVLQEEQIREALEQMGLAIAGIDVINLEMGKVEIEIIHQYMKGFDECRKIIAPLLSDILGENIVVKKEQFSQKGEAFYTVTFGSMRQYGVETGVAGAAKGGDLLSGDSFSTKELGNGKYAVALSDGMGNGERANMESSTALTVLQQLLQSGMDERLAIKSVNSVLMLRSADEMFATVDMALIDLYSASTTFLKIGSTPSFIRRGGEVIQVAANNLPVGIMQDIEVDLLRVQLLPGDILIMMTDGLYDAPGYAMNKDLWMKRMIQEISVEGPQEMADCLLERIVRHLEGEIVDDMTVIVARIERYQPEWAALRWPALNQIERPKTVS
ncbi:MAG: stage II sporulation protein E [Paenibacillaceae bacterium]